MWKRDEMSTTCLAEWIEVRSVFTNESNSGCCWPSKLPFHISFQKRVDFPFLTVQAATTCLAEWIKEKSIIWSQAINVASIKTLVPITLHLQPSNYSNWRGLFLVALTKYALEDHVKTGADSSHLAPDRLHCSFMVLWISVCWNPWDCDGHWHHCTHCLD